MSFRINNMIVICPETQDAKCEMCGEMKELRPYGRKGQCVCFDCGQTIPDIIAHNAKILLFGAKGELK